MTAFRASKPGWRRTLAIVGVCLAGLAGLAGLAAYRASLEGKLQTGVLYFTTFDHQALYSAPFSFRNGRPAFGSTSRIAALPNADGVVFASNGHALVGGQSSGNVLDVDTETGRVNTVASGCTDAFLQALSPSGRFDYTAGNPGPLCELPADPLRPGHQVLLKGDDPAITELGFDDHGHAFYTTAGATGIGNFGSIDLATGVTTRYLTQIGAAHGIAFDPFSQSLYLFGGETIYQIDPHHPLSLASSLTVPGVLFDHGTTDGQGHLFVASNRGQLVVIDTGRSGDLSAPSAQVSVVPLHATLDDIAPLEGPGTHAAPAKPWIPWVGGGLIGVALLAVLGQLDVVRVPQRRPAWDIRRQEDERMTRQRQTRRGQPRQRRPTRR